MSSQLPRRPQRRSSPDDDAGGPGDLFEHFGVELDDRRGQPAAVVDGRPCSGCGWLLRIETEDRCPLCGRVQAGSKPTR